MSARMKERNAPANNTTKNSNNSRMSVAAALYAPLKLMRSSNLGIDSKRTGFCDVPSLGPSACGLSGSARSVSVRNVLNSPAYRRTCSKNWMCRVKPVPASDSVTIIATRNRNVMRLASNSRRMSVRNIALSPNLREGLQSSKLRADLLPDADLQNCIANSPLYQSR